MDVYGRYNELVMGLLLWFNRSTHITGVTGPTVEAASSTTVNSSPVTMNHRV